MKMGDTVPADMRVVEAMNFETDEALLTGESLPVRKSATADLEHDCPVGDKINMVFSSSTVTKGRAKGIVTATGMATELGAIAKSLKGENRKIRKVKKDEAGNAAPHRYVEAAALTVWDQAGRFLGLNVGTPLQRKLSRLAIGLFIIAVIFAIIVLAANHFSSSREVIIYAVATGLSMIPASLIVVLTITMAVGTKQMVQRNVIVRKLDSLEALGAVTDICSDKTGTLTQGKMVLRKAWVIDHGTYSVGAGSEAFNPQVGALSFSPLPPADPTGGKDQPVSTDAGQRIPELGGFLNVASLANLASVFRDQESGEWDARGDPTEIALQVFVMKLGWGRKGLQALGWTQVAEFPFDSELKRMSVIFEKSGEKQVFMKGAVERVLEACPDYADEEKRRVVLKNMEALASQGLRVLALGSRSIETVTEERSEVESNIKLLGLVGLYDPPRGESQGAVQECHIAGINVHMLTGDHPATAKAIAQQVGIIPKNLDKYAADVVSSMVMTAQSFDRMSDEEIDNLPVLPLVIARCAPQTKVRMIEALHRRKAFCAMTGDGVNDSPSLKKADVGIAMGMAGSDVAKDASDIVLTDDNFASIVNAIEEGRRMFDNIKKVLPVESRSDLVCASAVGGEYCAGMYVARGSRIQRSKWHLCLPSCAG
jgi:P-type Na+/K+ transporter